MDYPIQRPLDDHALIGYICNLYKKSIVPLLPFTILMVVLYHFMILGQPLLPPAYRPIHMQLAMFMLVLMLPLFCAMVTLVHHIATARGYRYKLIAYHIAARLLSLFGCILSIILLPLIVLGLCFAVYFAMGMYKAPFWSMFVFYQLIPIFVFAIFVSRVFAPILVYTQNLDANLSIDESVHLVKGYYWRTFIFTLFSFLILVLLAKIPDMMVYYLPQSNAISLQMRQLIADILLIIFAPWTISSLIMQLEDLQIRRKEKRETQIEKNKMEKIEVKTAKGGKDMHF